MIAGGKLPRPSPGKRGNRALRVDVRNINRKESITEKSGDLWYWRSHEGERGAAPAPILTGFCAKPFRNFRGASSMAEENT